MSRKGSFAFLMIAASSLPVVWFSLGSDLHLNKADNTTSTAVESRISAANQKTMRILALDQARRLAFWTHVLKNKKQTCDSVVRAMYQGGTESGLDYWGVRCQDGNEYSLRVEPDAKESVCTGNAFDLAEARQLIGAVAPSQPEH